MKVSIRGKNIVISATLKKAIAARVRLALGGFADRIALVNVAITKPAKVAKAEGGKPTACRVEVTITRKIKVEAAHADPLEAVSAALESAHRKVARMLRQEQDDELKPTTKRPARI